MKILLTMPEALKITNQLKVTEFNVIGYRVSLGNRKFAHKLVNGNRVYATEVEITDLVNLVKEYER